ncbi:MAG: hypothetical protein WC795_01500 [Candidatus Paceibacterota bacterium]|jgi:hypothetical protein
MKALSKQLTQILIIAIFVGVSVLAVSAQTPSASTNTTKLLNISSTVGQSKGYTNPPGKAVTGSTLDINGTLTTTSLMVHRTTNLIGAVNIDGLNVNPQTNVCPPNCDAETTNNGTTQVGLFNSKDFKKYAEVFLNMFKINNAFADLVNPGDEPIPDRGLYIVLRDASYIDNDSESSDSSIAYIPGSTITLDWKIRESKKDASSVVQDTEVFEDPLYDSSHTSCVLSSEDVDDNGNQRWTFNNPPQIDMETGQGTVVVTLPNQPSVNYDPFFLKITCSDSFGDSISSLDLLLKPGPQVYLASSRSEVAIGDSVDLSWDSATAPNDPSAGGYCVRSWVENNFMDHAPQSGTNTITVTQSKPYSITCFNQKFVDNHSLQGTYKGIYVNALPKAQTTALDVKGILTSNGVLTVGKKVIVSSLAHGQSGYKQVCLDGSKKLVFCTVTTTLRANPSTVIIGNNDTTTLSWSSTNASNCMKSGAWSGSTNGVTTGSQVITPSTQGANTYTITCTGHGTAALNQATASVTVQGFAQAHGSYSAGNNGNAGGTVTIPVNVKYFTVTLWGAGGTGGNSGEGSTCYYGGAGGGGGAGQQTYIELTNPNYPAAKTYNFYVGRNGFWAGEGYKGQNSVFGGGFAQKDSGSVILRSNGGGAGGTGEDNPCFGSPNGSEGAHGSPDYGTTSSNSIGSTRMDYYPAPSGTGDGGNGGPRSGGDAKAGGIGKDGYLWVDW